MSYRPRYVIARLPDDPITTSPLGIRVVSDQACPRCGAFWGHPDPRLNFPNRIKVDTSWKCYNPDCTCAYYENGRVLENKLDEAETAAMHARVHAEVEAMLADKVWITKGNTSKVWPKDEAIPLGWHLTGTERTD
jgi:predicted DsbA family dithiol-disulfide isomerase